MRLDVAELTVARSQLQLFLLLVVPVGILMLVYQSAHSLLQQLKVGLVVSLGKLLSGVGLYLRTLLVVPYKLMLAHRVCPESVFVVLCHFSQVLCLLVILSCGLAVVVHLKQQQCYCSYQQQHAESRQIPVPLRFGFGLGAFVKPFPFQFLYLAFAVEVFVESLNILQQIGVV